MLLNVNEKGRTVEIWIPNENRADYAGAREYYSALNSYREQGYQVRVFVGGSGDLSEALTNKPR